MRQLIIDRVDLVDRGANPDAAITIAKVDHDYGAEPMTHVRKRSEVLDEVQELAEEVQQHQPGLSDAEARAVVWGELPELYEEYREATPEPETEPVAKTHREPTLADVVAEAVHKRAEHLAWTQWPDKSEDEIRAGLWLSDDGAELYGLAKSELGAMPSWQTRRLIRKNTAHQRALQILESWQ